LPAPYAAPLWGGCKGGAAVYPAYCCVCVPEGVGCVAPAADAPHRTPAAVSMGRGVGLLPPCAYGSKKIRGLARTFL